MNIMQKKAIENIEAGIRAIMDTKVELTKLGIFTADIDQFLTEAAAELGVYLMGNDRIFEGVAFIKSLADEYEDKFKEAVLVHKGEMAAYEAEAFANRNNPQDS